MRTTDMAGKGLNRARIFVQTEGLKKQSHVSDMHIFMKCVFTHIDVVFSLSVGIHARVRNKKINEISRPCDV